jgi:hypothetical protein
MTTAIALFDDIPAPTPLLDRAAVEQARLVRVARDHLVSTDGSVDYEHLAIGRGGTVLAARQWVKRQRAKGRLFVVEHDGRTLIPSFQLGDAFDLDDRVGDAVAQLTAFGMSGWAIWRWFTSINPWIETRPLDALGTSALDTAIVRLTDG